MTEADWNICTDPQRMLEFLLGVGKASDRKLRLFACACARRVWDAVEEQCHPAIEAAERFVDEGETADELRGYYDLASGEASDSLSNMAAANCCESDAEVAASRMWYADNAAHEIAGRAALASAMEDDASADILHPQVQVGQCHLLRDIFGPLPFRP